MSAPFCESREGVLVTNEELEDARSLRDFTLEEIKTNSAELLNIVSSSTAQMSVQDFYDLMEFFYRRLEESNKRIPTDLPGSIDVEIFSEVDSDAVTYLCFDILRPDHSFESLEKSKDEGFLILEKRAILASLMLQRVRVFRTK